IRAKVTSRWASNDGGSAETIKVSVPPVRGCWAPSGADSSQNNRPVTSTATMRSSGRRPRACDPCIDSPSLGGGRQNGVLTTVRRPRTRSCPRPWSEAGSRECGGKRLHRPLEACHRRPPQPGPDLSDSRLAGGDAGIDAGGDPGPHDLADIDPGGCTPKIQLRGAQGGGFWDGGL